MDLNNWQWRAWGSIEECAMVEEGEEEEGDDILDRWQCRIENSQVFQLDKARRLELISAGEIEEMEICIDLEEQFWDQECLEKC